MAVSSGDELFAFNWCLENYTVCPCTHGDVILSPTFTVDALNTTGWCLKLYPCGTTDSESNCLVCCLCRRKVREGEPKVMTICFSMSIFTQCEGAHQTGTQKNVSLVMEDGKGFSFSTCEIFSEDEYCKNIYLPSDILNIECCFWRPDAGISWRTIEKSRDSLFPFSPQAGNQTNFSQEIYEIASGKLNIKKCPNKLNLLTRMEVDRFSFSWTLKGFSKMQKHNKDFIVVPSPTADLPSLALIFRLNEKDQIELEIQRSNNQKKMCVICTVTIVNIHGDSLKSMKQRHIFPVQSDAVWNLPAFINKSQILAEESRYLVYDVLNLRFDFVISYEGKVSHTIGDLRFPECSLNSSGAKNSVNDKLLRVNEDKKHCDVRLNVKGMVFPAPKAVICLASPVFGAMFDYNMKENNTGDVNIPDFDSDTIDRLFRFVYSGVLNIEGLKQKNAMTLYSAACKYQIQELKRQCLNYLTSNIAGVYIHDILRIAELYNDESLKKAAIKYIFW